MAEPLLALPAGTASATAFQPTMACRRRCSCPCSCSCRALALVWAAAGRHGEITLDGPKGTLTDAREGSNTLLHYAPPTWNGPSIPGVHLLWHTPRPLPQLLHIVSLQGRQESEGAPPPRWQTRSRLLRALHKGPCPILGALHKGEPCPLQRGVALQGWAAQHPTL